MSTKIYTMESEELFSSSEETSKESEEDSRPFYLRSKRFSAAQRACLSVNGMTRTSKKYSPLISKTANDTDLSVKQVKV